MVQSGLSIGEFILFFDKRFRQFSFHYGDLSLSAAGRLYYAKLRGDGGGNAHSYHSSCRTVSWKHSEMDGSFWNMAVEASAVGVIPGHGDVRDPSR